ncbi:hypothetical protein TruAng_011545 [Truncatella angustata]|nr:hypothetical protein TruAng_011545 [Truncatella angustata]
MVDWTSILPPSVVADTVTPKDPELAPATNTTVPTTSGLNNGAPYLPSTAQLGGVPTPPIDNPISAVLTFLFLVAAAAHMVVFQIFKRRNHLFVFSAMMFAFSLIRALALVLRMAWASHETNVRLAIAAGILAQAGTILVFIINLFFAQRVLRGYHPNFGWSKPAGILFNFLFASVVISLMMIIVTTVQSFFTLDEATRERDHAVQLFGGTYLAVLAFLPIPIVVVSAIAPRKYVVEKFGTGRWRTKLFLLLFTSAIMSLGAGFRAGANFAPRPIDDPAWYHGRGPYYAFNYGLDLVTTYLYLGVEFHKRFFVPNGAKGPGSYMSATSLPTEKARPAPADSTKPAMMQSADDGYGPSVETLASQHYSESAPSPTVYSSKMPITYVGYNDSSSSLKPGQKKSQQQQGRRLSKAHSRAQQRSNTSLYSQDTFVGSVDPGLMDTPPLTRTISGATEHIADEPPNLPPVPILPAAFEDMYGGSSSSSREGSGSYILENDSSRRTSGNSFAGARTAAAGGNRGSGSTSTDKRSSDVLSDMLQKMDSVRHSAGSHGKAASVERTSEGLRMWSPTWVDSADMSGAMDAGLLQQQQQQQQQRGRPHNPAAEEPPHIQQRRRSQHQSFELEVERSRPPHMQTQYQPQRQQQPQQEQSFDRQPQRRRPQSTDGSDQVGTSEDSSSYHTGESNGSTSDGTKSRPQTRQS